MLRIIISTTAWLTTFFSIRSGNIKKDTSILAIINAVVTTPMGIYRYIEYMADPSEYSCTGGYIDKFYTIFFCSYMLADLCLGFTRFYGKDGLYINRVHHCSFILLSCVMYICDHTKCTTLSFGMELSSIFLALKPYFRGSLTFYNNIMFGITFGITRIILLVVILYHICLNYSKNIVIVYYLPVLIPMLLVYLSWFKIYLIKLVKLNKYDVIEEPNITHPKMLKC